MPSHASGRKRIEEQTRLPIVLFERRALIREGLAAALSSALGQSVVANESYDCVNHGENGSAALFILSVSAPLDSAEVERDVSQLCEMRETCPAIVVGDADELAQVVKLLDCGIRGVIPTSARLSVAVEAIRMVQAGGTYIPASCVMNARRPALAAEARRLGVSLLTPRQSVVVEALRRGKANKAIAYELRMRESTVKVHVRNVMKKLGAKNRTEVAYIANNLFNASRGSASRMFAAEAVCNPHSRLARGRAPGANLAVQLCERQSSLVDD